MNQGFIKITDALLKQEWSNLYVFMKDFRPTYIEFRHWENNIWYFYGESKKFDLVKEGDAIPEYNVLFTKNHDGSLSYCFTKVL